MRIRDIVGAALLSAAAAGCSGLRGPGIEFTAPRVTGRVVNDADGSPLAGARIGRELYQTRGPTGEFWKGAEELRLLQSFRRAAADGSFELPGERVALLLRFGDVPLNLRLTVQKSRFHSWQTNFPYAALGSNWVVLGPRINAGEIRLRQR